MHGMRGSPCFSFARAHELGSHWMLPWSLFQQQQLAEGCKSLPEYGQRLNAASLGTFGQMKDSLDGRGEEHGRD